MIRLFVGLDLPEDLKDRLEALSAGIPNARWEIRDNLHVTLRFIGEVDEQCAADIDQALAQIAMPAFTMAVSGFNSFGSGRGSQHQARTLWAKVEKSPELQHLHDKVESAVVRAGLPPEPRKFTPHITIAKVKGAPMGRIQDFVARNSLFQAGPVPVENFTLFRSHLGRSGAIYEALADYPLVNPLHNL